MSQRAVIASKLANMRQGERTDLGSIEPRLSLEQAAELLCAPWKVGVQICTPSISLPAHGFDGLLDKRRRLRAFALALARAAEFVYGLPGEPLQAPDKLLLCRDLFCIIQRKSKVPAAMRT